MMSKIPLDNPKKKRDYSTVILLIVGAIAIIALVKAFSYGIEKQYNVDQASMCEFAEGATRGPLLDYYIDNCTK